MLLLADARPAPAEATVESGGDEITGSAPTCDASMAGALRYLDGGSRLERCDDGAWSAVGEGGDRLPCPAGFTLLQNARQTLGCMQNDENEPADWLTAANTCWTSYGGRLPSRSEWYVAANNYTLSGETDDSEWTEDGAIHPLFGYVQITVGNGSVSEASSALPSASTAYRCLIPAR